MRRPAQLLLCLVVLFFAVRSVAAQEVRVTEDSPVEAVLVMIDTGQPLVSEELVEEYGALLDELEPQCPEDRAALSDIAIQSSTLAKQSSGHDVQVRTILEETLEATQEATGETGGQECSSVMASVIMRMQQE